jgi:hypothetical protein
MAPPPDPRASSLDRIPRSQPGPPSLDGEEIEDAEAPGVADGFRPPEVAASHRRVPSAASQHRDPSTIKTNRASLALRHDGAMGPVASRNSTANSVPNRSWSISTDATFVRAESPYQGPAGPSHPYRIYPQNTVPEADAAPAQSPLVMIGFPGLNNNYRRRLGPDGEEAADIIGQDGHTEQLPPYSKYPDEAFARKALLAAQVLLPGAGGIGLATRDPEFASREDLNTPRSRGSTQSVMSGSSRQINTAAQGASEKDELKKWQKVARRRVCGIIPIWAIALVSAAFLLFAIILAAVLATLWHRHQIGKHHTTGDRTQP